MEEVITMNDTTYYLMFVDDSKWRYAYYVDTDLKTTYYISKMPHTMIFPV